LLKNFKEQWQREHFFIRPHPSKIFAWGFTEKNKGEYDWAIVDFVVSTIQEYNAHLLATIYTWNPWDQKERAFFNPWLSELLLSKAA
jgi:hypothetical protein